MKEPIREKLFKKLKKITAECVAKGLLDEDDVSYIWGSAKEAGKQAYADAKA